MRIAGLVRRVEATATSAVPVVVWAFLGPWLLGSVLRVESALNYVLAEPLPDWLLLGGVWALAAVWVVLDGATIRKASDGGMRRATYGMRSRGVEFRSPNLEVISFGECALRIIVGILVLPLAPISFFVAVRDRQRKTIPDWVCGTVVCLSEKCEDRFCAKCGYNLRGLTEQRCPECAKPFIPEA